MVGYHVEEVSYFAADGSVVTLPVIRKDGGTGSWRDAKKAVRDYYIQQAKQLRQKTEKTYFGT